MSALLAINRSDIPPVGSTMKQQKSYRLLQLCVWLYHRKTRIYLYYDKQCRGLRTCSLGKENSKANVAIIFY